MLIVHAHSPPRGGTRHRQRLPPAATAERRRLFGNPAIEYPRDHTPKPYSRRFVLHLDHWYAQSHPDEDFAETFAVWLDPQSMWETRYAGWPAKRNRSRNSWTR